METRSRTFCREGTRKWKILGSSKTKTDESKNRELNLPSLAKALGGKRGRAAWSRYLFPFLSLFFLLFIVAGELARRDERGILVRRTNERRKFALKDDGQPRGSAQYLCRGACKRRIHGNNKIICHWPICIRRSRVPWRQACKVQLNEPSLNIVWKITSVTRILLPPPPFLLLSLRAIPSFPPFCPFICARLSFFKTNFTPRLISLFVSSFFLSFFFSRKK